MLGEVIHVLSSCLHPIDILHLSACNSSLNSSFGEKYWQRLCCSTFLISPDGIQDDDDVISLFNHPPYFPPPWKYIYLRKYKYYHHCMNLSSDEYEITTPCTGDEIVDDRNMATKRIEHEIFRFIYEFNNCEDTTSLYIEPKYRNLHTNSVTVLKSLYAMLHLCHIPMGTIVSLIAVCPTQVKRVLLQCFEQKLGREYLILTISSMTNYHYGNKYSDVRYSHGPEFPQELCLLAWYFIAVLPEECLVCFTSIDLFKTFFPPTFTSSALHGKLCTLGLFLLKSSPLQENISFISRVLKYACRCPFFIILPLLSAMARVVKNNGPSAYTSWIPEVLQLYTHSLTPSQSLTQQEDQRQFEYHGVPAPWVRVKIFQLLQQFTNEQLQPYFPTIKTMVQELLKEAKEAMRRECDEHGLNAVFSVVMEGVKAVILLPSALGLLEEIQQITDLPRELYYLQNMLNQILNKLLVV